MFQIDTKKIWKTIARWWDCIVKKYGHDEVVKFSTLSKFIWTRHSKKLIYDYKISYKYLGKYITKTIYTKHKNQHIEIQKYIQGEILKKKHFKYAVIRNQFHEILQGIEKMKQDKLPALDLIWFHWVLKQWFDNIIVDNNMKLHIIDVALLESSSVGTIWYIFHPLMIVARWIQKIMISYFLKT